MTKIERSEHTEPGYDCMYGPCVAGFGKPGRPGVPLEQRLAKERASLASDPSWVTRRFQNLEKK